MSEPKSPTLLFKASLEPSQGFTPPRLVPITRITIGEVLKENGSRPMDVEVHRPGTAERLDQLGKELATARDDISRLCAVMNDADAHRERTPEERKATRAKFRVLMTPDGAPLGGDL